MKIYTRILLDINDNVIEEKFFHYEGIISYCGIHYDFKSTRGAKAMEKQAKREKKLAERRAKKQAKAEEKGVTTKNEIRRLFGPPWLSGIKDGQPAWTYGSYDYSLFGERKAKDLVVQFDDKGKVSSFTFSTTDHDE